MNLHRKFRKLLRNPKQFFEDMRLKRFRNLRSLAPKKMEGHSHYTVVSAVYNVGRYLDQYFQSLVDQRLDFQNNITLVMVDDGSTDDSADIIQRWQQRYPNNIVYVHKENGGQASARNLGLNRVETEWVTFIDPDDFVDINYFIETDNFLKRNKLRKIGLVSCNFIYFYEDRNQFSDSHPLKYRFKNGDTVLPSSNPQKHLQLSASTAFFKFEIIKSRNIFYDPRIRPNFEDGHFIGKYLSILTDENIGICSRARYFYRKRADGSSTLDLSWSNPGKYIDVFQYGYIDLLETYKKTHNQIPKHVQRTVLYDLMWHLRHLINKPERCGLRNQEDIAKYLNLLDATFKQIDDETILEFELAGSWFFHKVGILGAFKNAEPPFQIAYIENYDSIKSLVQLRYFTASPGLEIFEIDGQDTIPAFVKTVRHDFLGRTFVLERRIWLPVPTDFAHAKLRVHINGTATRLTFAKKAYHEGLDLQQVRQHFAPHQTAHKNGKSEVKSKLWLLMDRDSQADDNAEHFYRYVRSRHPTQPIAFVLRRESHDWPRLKQEGFNLLAFGSAEHEAALQSCDLIISSHADQYVVDYFGDRSLSGKPFVFLQHGVTHNDLSGWLNSKQRIDCFVTAARPEYESIAGDFNRYKFTKKEVVLTGFPRHDSLLGDAHPTERVILIMPTWRKYLLGKVIDGNERARNTEFMATAYAKAWQSVLQSPQLRTLAEEHGYRVLFFPHANIQPYLADFEVPPHIDVLAHAQTSIQELFQRAALMITDFSSVAFEMAFLQKPVIYYQFDEAAFFKGEHIHQQGYFDYRRDGFGPVVVQEAALLEALSSLLQRNAKPAQEYLARMEAFFPFRDGRNCERVYQAIVALDQPLAEDFADPQILLEYAQAASQAGQWTLAEHRWRRYLQTAAVPSRAGKPAPSTIQLVRELMPSLTSQSSVLMSEAGLAAALLSELGDDDATPSAQEQALLALAQRDWSRLVSVLHRDQGHLNRDPLARLLLARAYREQGLLPQADEVLAQHEDQHGQSTGLTLERARLAASAGRWTEVLQHFCSAYPEGVLAMPLSDGLLQVRAYRHLAELGKAQSDLELLSKKYPACVELTLERAELAVAQKNWDQAATQWRSLCGVFDEAPYRLAMSLRFMGDINGGLAVLLSHQDGTQRSPDE